MGDESSENNERKSNSYFYEEHLKCLLPSDNIHEEVIDVENLIHGFASIPFYERVGIIPEEIPSDIRHELDSSASMHYKSYLEKRTIKNHCRKTSSTKRMNPILTPNLSGSLIQSLYGNDFSSDCLSYLMTHSSKPLPIEAIIFDEEDMAEVEEKDITQWKNDFNEFVNKFEGDTNRTVAIISSEESELSEELDEGYEETYDMREKFERLGKIINASAAMVIKEKKILPRRSLNMDFDEIPFDPNKPYPHALPTDLRDFDFNAQERERRRTERSKIRYEREKRRLQRLSLWKGTDQEERELLPHPMMEASNSIPEERKKPRRSCSSSDEDDLKHLEWRANNKIKNKLAKEKRKRSFQVEKSFKKKGL